MIPGYTILRKLLKILTSNSTIFTGKSLPHNRPDITFVNKQQNMLILLKCLFLKKPEFLKMSVEKIQSMLT